MRYILSISNINIWIFPVITTLDKVTCDGPKPSPLTALGLVSDQWSLVSPVTFDG
jgi:hypothetical protein